MLQGSIIRQRKVPPPSIYDPAGNILSKTVAGKTTTYTYDKANQLVSSKTADGKVTKYEYDAAGRMVKEGEKTFAYGWLDKVMQVAENGKTTQTYTYDMLGQLAIIDHGAIKETFLWDGLTLLSRNSLKYVNEPAITGGKPILAGDKMLFDDLLGNTLGVKEGEKFSAIDRDAFGELKPGEKPNLAVNFFTGKPEIEGLGYSFLFRNYRADLGKWQTTDPLGYPDGWNNLAYVNNCVTMNIDWLGGKIKFSRTVSPSDQAKFNATIAAIEARTDSSGAALVKAIKDSDKEIIVMPDSWNGGKAGLMPMGTAGEKATFYYTFDESQLKDKYSENDGYYPDDEALMLHELTHAKQFIDGRLDDMDDKTRELEACKEENQYWKDIGSDKRRKTYGKYVIE